MLKVLSFIFLITPNLLAGELKPMTCQYDGKIKSYLENDFSKGYPRDVVYKCGYNCLSLDDSYVQIMGTHQVKVTSLNSEAHRTVCQGVLLKKTRFGFDINNINSFYAHSSETPEVKKWAHLNGRNTNIEKQLTKKLIKVLDEVIQGYKLAGTSDSPVSESFMNSARVLEEIKNELISNNLVSLTKWLYNDLNQFDQGSYEYLTLIILHEHAKWLQ